MKPQKPRKRPPAGKPAAKPLPVRPKNPPQPQRPVPRRNSMFMPKYPCVESMCEKCPFHPSGQGFARKHEDFPDILQTIELGMPFFCHETVILDVRTKMGIVEGVVTPVPPIQDHFRSCLGAVKYKRGELNLKGEE